MSLIFRLFKPATSEPREISKGQIWEYETRKGEESSRLYVLKVEQYGRETVFHVALDNLHMKNLYATGGVQTELPHIAVSAQSMAKSITKLCGTLEGLPLTTEGYLLWKESYAAGEASVYRTPIKKVINQVESLVKG